MYVFFFCLFVDCGAINEIYNTQHFARNDVEAAAMGLKAGCDSECGSEFVRLNDAVQEGLVSQPQIDTAVTRVLKAYFALGLLDPDSDNPYSKLDMSVVANHVELARQAARESIILLSNSANTLPLQYQSNQTIALIGPCSHNTSCHVGDYGKSFDRQAISLFSTKAIQP